MRMSPSGAANARKVRFDGGMTGRGFGPATNRKKVSNKCTCGYKIRSSNHDNGIHHNQGKKKK